MLDPTSEPDSDRLGHQKASK